MENNHVFDEKMKMTDLLTSQKTLCSLYNTYCCEAADTEVRNSLADLLADEHRIQTELFSEMSTRGWYQTEQAEEQKIQSERMKFSSAVTK
jgi:spore coat protein CotF